MSNLQLFLAAGAAACYGAGYPLALVSHLAVGWILVTFGGVLLVALGTVTIQRMTHEANSAATETTPGAHGSGGERPGEK
ncbi:MAG: hypothetical protein ABI775_02375 [Pseudonocardiales bacterium]